MKKLYDADFFAGQRDGSLRAARVVVPILLSAFPARSAADVGCGAGAWLRALHDAGVADVDGYDGGYVDRAMLRVAPERFHAVDLRDAPALPRRYDLALSLEVAEHLPPDCADGFVAMLTRAAPVVAFSAAIPGQGGVGHLNERWQDHWRGLFATRGYRPVDLVRPAIRGRPDVPFWYQQNLVVYCDEETLHARPDMLPVPDAVSLDLVHPELYGRAVRCGEMSVTKALRMLPGLAAASLRRRLAGASRPA